MGFRKRNQLDGVQEELLKNIGNHLRELSFSYEKLGKTLKKMPKTQWELSEEEKLHVLGRTSVEVCQDCEEYYRCYRQEKDGFLYAGKRVICSLEKHDTGKRDEWMGIFDWKCKKRETFLDALLQSYEMAEIHKSWKNKMLSQRKVMAGQMEEVSRVLFDCSRCMGHEKKTNHGLVAKARKRLKEEKIWLERMELLECPGKRRELFLVARKKGKGMAAISVAKILEDILQFSLVPTRDCRVMLYSESTLLHFKEDVSFQILSGVAHRTKDGERDSGDLYSILRLEDGKQICMITDGMGSGKEAKEESRQMIELMEQLLLTGFREEEAIKLANASVTLGLEPSMYASVDMLSVNLYTGLMKMMKSGSAATFLLRENRVEILQSGSLPAGFLWEVEFDVIYKKLYDGDRIVLMSDGVLESNTKGIPEEEIMGILSLARLENPQQAADEILEAVLERGQNRAVDDMTVIVLSLWKKRKR